MLGFALPAKAATATLKPLKSLPTGTYVSFAGYIWILLDPSTGYLLKQDSLGLRAFDPSGNNMFNPNDSNDTTNIGYYLNNTFYNSLPAADRLLIQNYSWTTGNETNESSSSVNAWIGLLSYSEYTAYSSENIGFSSSAFVLGDYWTRIPVSSGGSPKTWASTLGPGPTGLHEYYVTEGALVNPTLHLNPGLLVSVNNGQPVVVVVGGTYENVSILSNCAAGVTAAGGGAYAPGDTVTATAETAALVLDPGNFTFKLVPTGYNFLGWTDESGALVSSNATYSFTMGTTGRTLVGNFQKAPVITVVNSLPFSITIYNTNGALTGTYNGPYGSITSIADGNNNIITGTLQGLPTTGQTTICLGTSLTAVTLDFQAVNPPSTTLDSSKSFY